MPSVLLKYSLSLSLFPVASTLEHRASVKRFFLFSFLILRESVGFLGRGTSLSQGRYLQHTYRINTNVHALTGIRTHDPSVRVAEAVHDLNRAATVIGSQTLLTHLNTRQRGLHTYRPRPFRNSFKDEPTSQNIARHLSRS
jgi:hypothetical protein